MKILFIAPREKSYNSETVRQQPCGGTEKANIFLGEAFQKLGHQVGWVTHGEQLDLASVLWADVIITQEAPLFALHPIPEAKKVWWCHHFHDQPIIQRSAAYARSFADNIVTLSQCQHDDFKRNLRIDSTIIGHGVWLDEVHVPVEKDPYRLIYASTPFRGLERIPDLFKAIKEREPRATIAIASSMATYGTPEKDEEYTNIFYELGRIDGVELLGSLNQEQLYREFARASVFFYPCVWPETYCMVMDEAIAHGCVPITSGLGALEERAECMDGFKYGEFFNYNPWIKQPKDWLEVAKQWEELVLN